MSIMISSTLPRSSPAEFRTLSPASCARRQDAPILFVGICLLDLALHRNAPYPSEALHLLMPI
jgi:hypothetical protein